MSKGTVCLHCSVYVCRSHNCCCCYYIVVRYFSPNFVSILWHIAHSLFNCSLKMRVMIQEDGLRTEKKIVAIFSRCVTVAATTTEKPHECAPLLLHFMRMHEYAFVSSGMHLIHKSLFIQFIHGIVVHFLSLSHLNPCLHCAFTYTKCYF